MAGLEDLVRSSAPGGSIGKPLMLALLALLASGALFRGSGTSPAATTGSQPTSDAKERVACSEDWVDSWTNYRRAGWARSRSGQAFRKKN
jgi:hypothetical protein